MPCYFPVGTYRKDGSACFRPCGDCIGCRLERSRQWAMRCVHEASLHDTNSFITLTYNDDNLPLDGSINKKHLQKFIKRLRRKIEPIKIRYYGAGEYGKKFSRPHYHLCLFGFDFPDKQLLEAGERTYFNGRFKNTKGNDLFTSDLLGKVWKKGFHTIGELTFESAGYAARYCTKKINGEKAGPHYKDKTPEFALMSRRPGIGSGWFEKWKGDIYPKDFTTMRGIKQRPPRFYDSMLEKKDPELFEQVKNERRKEKPYQSHMRLYHRQRWRKQVTKTLERNLENG